MKNNKILWLIAIILFISTYFFNYSGFKGRITLVSVGIIVIILIVYTFSNLYYFNQRKTQYPSARYLYLFSFLPLFSICACYYAHGQSFYHSVLAWIVHYLFLCYFLMARNRIRTKDIIYIIIIFAMIRTGITIIEQITYPNAPFAFRMDRYDEYGKFIALEKRSGFYRFMIGDAYFLVLFSGIYSFVKIVDNFSAKYAIVFIASALGIYMDGSRQVMISFVSSIMLYPIISEKKGKFKFFLLFGFLFMLLFSYFDDLFGELYLRTSQESKTFNNRNFSYAFFAANEGEWYTKIFGNGLEVKMSSWGKQLLNLRDMSIRPHDVGFVGAIYMVGWPIVLSFFIYFIDVVWRNWKKIDMSVRLYLLTILMMSPMVFPLYNTTQPCWEMFLGIIFYLVDASIIEKKRSEMKRIRLLKECPPING